MVLAYQTSGEFLRWNPHFHCLVLEGGFDDRGKFVHIPLGEIQRMSEYFRRVVIKSSLKKELFNAHLATSLINRKHSGFSVDHSIRIPAFSIRAREALSQYIARPPLSLKKIGIEEYVQLPLRGNCLADWPLANLHGEATAVCFTSQSELFKGKTETFPVIRLFLDLNSRRPPARGHIPPKGCQYIRRYGLYASRTKGTWPHKPHVVRLAPEGWKEQQQQAVQADQDVQPYDAEAADSVSDRESRSTCPRSPKGRRG